MNNQEILARFAEMLGAGGPHVALAYGTGEGKPTRQLWLDGPARIAAAVRRAASRTDVHLHAAVGVFTEKSRKAKFAKGCTGIVLDVDADIADSRVKDQVACVVSAVGTPSFYVHSGLGAHLYWFFGRLVPLEQWRQTAKAFKDFAATFDLISKDISGITSPSKLTRCPGSYNPKRGARATVQPALGSSGPVDFETFARAVANAVSARPSVAHAQDPVPQHAMDAVSALDAVGSHRPTALGDNDPERIKSDDPLGVLEDCRIFKRAMETGEQPYPLWFDAARACAWSKDTEAGREAFHKFSERHPGYDYAETDAKFDNALEESIAPPSCETVRASAGASLDACAGCPLAARKAALVTMVRAPAKGAIDDAAPDRTVIEADGGSIANMDSVLDFMEARRRSFRTFHSISEHAGTTEAARIACTFGASNFVMHPRTGEMLHINYAKGTVTKIASDYLAVVDVVMMDGVSCPTFAIIRRADISRAGVVHEHTMETVKAECDAYVFDPAHWTYRLAMPHDVAMKDKYTLAKMLRDLESSGLAIHQSPKAASIIREHISDQVMAFDASRRFNAKFGWGVDDSGESFLHGDILISSDGSVAHVPQVVHSKRMTQIRPAGSVKDARAATSAILDKLTPTGRFVFWCAMASPLMRFASTRSALIYLTGAGGTGKTALSRLATSPYYDTVSGTEIISGCDTLNSVFKTIGTLESLPVSVDETTLMRKEDFRQFSMQITQGRERGRLTSSGEKKQEAAEWQSVVLASANHEVMSIVPPINARSFAALSRVLSIDVGAMPLWDTEDGDFSFMPDLFDAMATCTGVVGFDFACMVVSGRERAEKLVRTCEESFDFRVGTNGDLGRFWRSAAAVAATALTMYGAHLGRDVQDDIDELRKTANAAFSMWREGMQREAARAAPEAINRGAGRMAVSASITDDEAAFMFSRYDGTFDPSSLRRNVVAPMFAPAPVSEDAEVMNVTAIAPSDKLSRMGGAPNVIRHSDSASGVDTLFIAADALDSQNPDYKIEPWFITDVVADKSKMRHVGDLVLVADYTPPGFLPEVTMRDAYAVTLKRHRPTTLGDVAAFWPVIATMASKTKPQEDHYGDNVSDYSDFR